MKIGILTSIGETVDAFFPPLIDHWQETGHDVVTAAAGPATNSEHTILNYVTRNPSLKNFRAPAEISAWAEEEGIDVLVTNTATASFLARIRRNQVPVVYFCHGLHWNNGRDVRSRVWQVLERFALRKTDAVVVLNHDDEDWFNSHFTRGEVHRLPGGVGVPIRDFPRSPIPAVEDTVELLWAGEFSERKRPWLAVETIRALLSQGFAVHLTMCGDGPYLENTRELLNKHGLENSVSLVGLKSNIPEILSGSHALLMTSAWEGLPRIGLEAIAMGRPVFAFDVKGTRSLPGVVLAPEEEVSTLSSLIRESARSGFSNIDFVDPAVLEPKYAADKITTIAERLTDDDPASKSASASW